MFKPVLAAGALLCALALSACNVMSPQVAGFLISGQTLATAAGQHELVAAARVRVVQACAYEPTADTVIAIAKTFAPSTSVTLTLVDRVAEGICAAAADPAVAYASNRVRARREGTYRNVPIRGRRIPAND